MRITRLSALGTLTGIDSLLVQFACLVGLLTGFRLTAGGLDPAVDSDYRVSLNRIYPGGHVEKRGDTPKWKKDRCLLLLFGKYYTVGMKANG